jgi:hypothetical protein
MLYVLITMSHHELTTLSCPLCKFTTKQQKRLDSHVTSAHDTSLQELWNTTFGGPKACQCGCGQVPKFIGWRQGYKKFILGHNGSIYKSYTKEVAEEISMKRKTSLTGKSSWCKGLTKETDERIAARGDATSKGRSKAFAEGRLDAWSKGLTKETDERIAANARRIASSYASGDRVPAWKGLTSETDERVAAMAKNVSKAHTDSELRRRLDSMKRLTHDDVTSRVEVGGKLTVIGGLDEYVNYMSPIVVRCNACEMQMHGPVVTFYTNRCHICDPLGSDAQTEVSDFMRSLDLELTVNDRSIITPRELDIYVSSRKFAVEFNGLYWHSLINKSSTYHREKSIAALNAGVRLMHVFEDEWRDRRVIVQSMIRARTGTCTAKFDARRCSIEHIDRKTRRQFFKVNHIDGDVGAKHAFGLFSPDGVLISCMSLRSPRFGQFRGKMWELARFASVCDAYVRGGLGKLTRHATKYVHDMYGTGLFTYVDTRFGGSQAYDAAGWRLHKANAFTEFWWTDFVRRLPRFTVRADKARGMSEREVAADAGLTKIGGCFNHIYTVT